MNTQSVSKKSTMNTTNSSSGELDKATFSWLLTTKCEAIYVAMKFYKLHAKLNKNYSK